jgi:hypothetical protein
LTPTIYKPYRTQIAKVWHSGGLPGDHNYDFRSDSAPQRRIFVSVRNSDKRVVAVIYFKLDFPDEKTPSVQSFSPEEIARLTAANQLRSGKLYSKLSTDGNDAQLAFAS